MRIEALDHLVLTVRDIPRTVAFYEQVMGMEARTFGTGRTALHFGRQKINLHDAASPIEPHAAAPTPGSADLCFLTDRPIADVVCDLMDHNVPILEGPVPRTGAGGPILSVYFRDPDGNLIEVSEPV
ncbi:VOC family protein [Luteolibacter ambystomatis]|uniref:VOC family protein n=2 Tax=Luteolibacter ambystomatis TaxID=2824561 RepID=A0A975PFZ8_9BACT|nr:VOC family protein [Luteolibacter ambystomatis]QUE52195.1 VOC family protein [Luteolibacter ambystomatis]